MRQDSFETCLLTQRKAHPSLQAQDVLKFCYQAAFGAEHLLRDEAGALAYFMEEYEAAPDQPQALCESVSGEYGRVNLSGWKHHRLPPEWLFKLFCLTAGEERVVNGVLFRTYLDRAGALAQAGELPFSFEAWEAYRRQYEGGDGGPVHHSAAYRAAEKPAYRLVGARYLRLLPVLEKMAALPDTQDACVLAVDGRAAAGKTTLAGVLSAVTGAGVVHMDDFFLPPLLRSDERLAQPGGNVHYERFAREVLPHLAARRPFAYTRFDCAVMDYGAPRQVAGDRWRIVEGSYSCHPAFGEYMHLRVFCDVAPDEQMRRIQKRNGPAMARRFAAEWIPLEERYLTAYGVADAADVTFTLADGGLPAVESSADYA